MTIQSEAVIIRDGVQTTSDTRRLYRVVVEVEIERGTDLNTFLYDIERGIEAMKGAGIVGAISAEKYIASWECE